MRVGLDPHRVGGLFLAVWVGAGLGVPAHAGAPDRIPVRGTFVLVPEESDDVERAIVEGTKGMGLTGVIARGRLRDTNPVYRTIAIDAAPDTVTLVFDGEVTLTAAATGEEMEWRYRGETFRVRTTWESGAVRQLFASADGTRENVTTLDADGVTLRVTTTVRASVLPGPIEYVLVYRRIEG